MKGLNRGAALLTIIIVLLMFPRTYTILHEYLISINNTFRILAAEVPGRASEVNKDNIPDKDSIKITFIFDGGYEGVYQWAYPLFKRYALKANVGVVPSLTKEKEYMNVSELTSLYLEGWDILNQTFPYQPDLYDNPTRLIEDIQRTKKWMDNRMFTRTSDCVIMTYGEINPYLIGLLKDKDYKSVRTSDNIIDLSKHRIEYKTIRAMDLTKAPDISAIENFLDDSYKLNAAAVFILSKVGENNDSGDKVFSQYSLKQLLEYLNENRDRFEVVSYSDLFT